MKVFLKSGGRILRFGPQNHIWAPELRMAPKIGVKKLKSVWPYCLECLVLPVKSQNHHLKGILKV